MSVQAIVWVIGNERRTHGLTGPKGSDRLVLISLANHASDGFSWPAIDILATEANVTEKTAKASIRWLIEHGYIERVVRGAPAELMSRPQARTNLYRLMFDAESEDDCGIPEGVNHGQKTEAPKRKSADSRGGKPRTNDAATPLPVEPLVTVSAEAADAEAPADEKPHVGIEAAKEIARWYFNGVEERTGKPPAGIRFMALAKGVIEPFVGHWEPEEIRPALRAMYDAGQTITRQNLERHLDGRAKKFGRPVAHDRQLAVMRFDEHGDALD